jgi:type 1 glutamine amidotransferase
MGARGRQAVFRDVGFGREHPNTWAREEGKGRVFYTATGHREDVWTNPTFQSILIGAIHWVTRDIDAAVPPNLMQVAPGAMTNPVFVEPTK